MKQLSGKIELIAHFAFDPSDLHVETSGRKGGRSFEEVFALLGIEDLRPIKRGSWALPLRNIHHDVVLRYLHEEFVLKKREIIGSTDGGLSLVHNRKMIFTSMCCSDLSNIDSWQRAAAHRKKEWLMVWIGHPWVYVRHQNGNLLFSDYTESMPTSPDAAKYAIPVKEFEAAVKQAHQDIEAFKQRLYDHDKRKP